GGIFCHSDLLLHARGARCAASSHQSASRGRGVRGVLREHDPALRGAPNLGKASMAIESQHSQVMLVAGGAGFLGSHLCDRLVGRGFPVLCIDNLVTGDLRNVLHLTEDASFSIQRHDISDPLELDGVEAIFNLACPASPVHYQADPIHTTMTSVRGAYN